MNNKVFAVVCLLLALLFTLIALKAIFTEDVTRLAIVPAAAAISLVAYSFKTFRNG